MKGKEEQKRRSGLQIMVQLVTAVKQLMPVMFLAIILGVLGFLCAIFLTIIAGYQVLAIGLEYMGGELVIENAGVLFGGSIKSVAMILIALAVLRGVLHYGEQYCNHYLAFRILAEIRNKVFTSLRRLCPAKLEGKDKGNLISIITSDIELLEVFYAHTLSPIMIGICTSIIMTIFIGRYSIYGGLWAALGYLSVGLMIPLIHGRLGGRKGMAFRTEFGNMNSFVLESLRGIDETIQYGCGEARREQMKEKSKELSGVQKELNQVESSQRSITTGTILFFSFGMFFLMLTFVRNGEANYDALLITTIAMMGSFGPVVALANLSNNLHQTLASGERVLSILEEEPQVTEITGREGITFEKGIDIENITFAYEEEKILDQYNMKIPKGKIVGIHGASGAGKSTMLKLLMRFWDPQSGNIIISDRKIKEINTPNLRNMQSYVTQETHIFQDTIGHNIGLGKLGATMEEIVEAAKKASIHEFILSLPQGYDTEVSELGDSLSGGERQRIGIARAFLHDAPILLLDEPTSNLDSLNEGIILQSLKEACQEKTVVLVSHRKSTMNVADVIFEK